MAIQTLEEYLKKKKQKTNNDDIAPVKSTTGVRTLEEYAKEKGIDLSILDNPKEEDKETFFDKVKDASEKALKYAPAYLYQSQMAQSGALRTGEDYEKLEKDVAQMKQKIDGKDEQWYEGWFKKGEGNLLERVGGTIVDTTQSLGKGVLGVGEKLYDAGIQASPYVYQSQMAQAYGGFQTAETIEQTEKTVEQMKKEAPELVEKDLYDEGKLVDKYYTKNAEKILGVDAEKNSVIGNKTDSVVESAGQMVTTLPLGGAGLVMQGLMAFGSESENAYKQGATFQEAGASGLITAGAEVGTELLGGGISFGQGTLDDILIDPLLKRVGSKGLRTGLKVGVEAGGEAGEEVLSGLISAYGQQQTYQEDKKMSELFSVEDAIESAIGGAMLGSVASGSKAVASTVKGTDYTTGETKSERALAEKLVSEKVAEATKQKALESEVEKAIAEREKAQGGKLTDKNKTALKESIMQKIDSGEIDISATTLDDKAIDTIKKEVETDLEEGNYDLDKLERTLTEEKTSQIEQLENTLKTTKDKKQKTEIEKQINELKTAKYTELSGLLKENKHLTKAVYEAKMSDTSYDYRENAADGEFAKAVKESAKTHLSNNTYSRNYVDAMAKLSEDTKTNYRFINNKELAEQGDLVEKKELSTEQKAEIKNLEEQINSTTDAKQKEQLQRQVEIMKFLDVGGMVKTDANGVETVLINVDSKQAPYRVLVHETKHVLEKSSLNEAYNEMLFKYAESNGDLDTFREHVKELYQTEDEATITKELSSELSAYYFSNDTKFLETITQDKTIVQKIKEVIDDLVIRFKGTEQQKQYRELQKKFEQMLKDVPSTENKAVAKNEQSLSDIASMTEKSYNHHGWAKVNDVLTDREMADFQQKVGDRERQGNWYLDLGNGRQMFAVGVDGVNSTLVISDGNFKNPSIEKVYHIGLNNETDIEELRSEIYEREKDGGRTLQSETIKNYFYDEPVEIYGRGDFFDYKELREEYAREKGKGNTRSNSNLQNRKRGNSKTQYSISEQALPEGSAFFNAQKEVYGFKVNEKAKVNEDLLEELSIHDPSAEVDADGNVTVYHRTSVENANEIKRTGVMKAQEDALFFSSKDSGYASDYGDAVVKLKIPSTVLEVNDIFDGEVHFDIPLKYKNGGFQLDVSKYLTGTNTRYSLSDTDSKDKMLQDLRVGGRDIAPVRKDIPQRNAYPDDFAPLTEEQANERDAQQGDRLYSLNENDMPDEPVMSVEEADSHVGQMLYGSKVEAEDPFKERDIKDVGKRNVKAYMYENPEVKPFFQQEAGIMLTELNETIKGERVVDADVLYHTGGEAGVYGTKRFTSDDIAYLRDSLKISYADIEKGLKAIIEDHGAENNAVSKRIEFVLNDRLGKGYKSFPEGMEIPANNEYLNTLVEKQVTEYSDEAKQKYFESLVETYTEDIAPIRDDIARPNEPVDVVNAKQLTMNEVGEIVEEDYQTRTRKEIRKALLEEGNIDLTSALDNAKNIPMALMNNTDTIRLSEMVFGREAGRKINDLIFQKTIDNEAKSVRWQNQERESIKELGIKARSKESEAVQKFGEGFYIDDKGKKIVYNEESLVKEFKNAETRAKIINASKVLREKYDNYIELANNTLTSLGFDPIPKRADYFRHFQELNDIFTRYGIPFNPQNVQEHVLPTDINGLTEFWSPQKNYFANAQPRKGLKTTYDAITGIDGYLSGISNLIFHTGDIQRGRAFEEVIRSTYGEEKGFDNFENLTPEEQQERIKKIQDNHLSNYSAWVHEWTNNIAGKKNKVDRAIESVFGRKAFAFLDETRKQVGSNMIGFNVSSALTNAIAPVQAMAKTNKLAVLKGTGDTVKNIFVKDNFAEKNDFLANRMGTEMLSKKPWEKMRDAGFVFMKGMDWFTSNQIVRSKYYELRSKGMSEANAHVEAGKFASRIMGDRTKGAMPQIYNSKLLGLVTQFQLEVNNQLYSTFYDTYHESKESAKDNALITASKMTFTLGQLFAYTHVFGKTFESIAGYNPTFDVIGIIATALGLGDDDEEKTTSERLKEASDKLVDALPYVNILTGGGRIPVASGIPNLIGVATGGKDEYGNEMTLEDELKKLLYLVPPTGGNQFKKTTQGLGMFADDLPISGSYTDSGNLRYPVEDTFINKVQAGIFGQYANENARTYFDEGRDSLKSKQIQEFAELDIPIREYWDYRDGLKEQDTLEEKFDYIAGLDLPVSKKNIMINNIVDREEAVDLAGYEDFSTYEEFDLYVKNPSKYVVSKVVGNYDTYKAFAGDLSDINADKDASGKTISGSRKEKVVNYINNLDIDYGAKLILLKSEYPATDDYNYEIIDYLNNREDITYEEMKTILEGLDFTVDEDGTIYWD